MTEKMPCAHCGVMFARAKKFCTKRCNGAARYAEQARSRRAADPEKMPCAHCGVVFEFTPSNKASNKRKFCASRCRLAACRASNPDKCERERAWREANRESIRARQRALRKANHERVREVHLSWREANREKLRERSRAYGAANPDKRAASQSKRRALKRNATVPLTLEEEARERAIYAESARNEGWEVDHIKPLAKGGLHHPDNLVAIPGTLNRQKNAQYWPDLHALQ